MVEIIRSLQTGKSMDCYDNSTIQKYIHCLTSYVRTDWEKSGLCQFSLLENFTYVNFTYIVRTRRFLSLNAGEVERLVVVEGRRVGTLSRG